MWDNKDEIQTLFFKCRKWQLEETLDPQSCPYHYYCNSFYDGDYTPAVDLLVLVFTLVSFSTAIAFMLIDLIRSGPSPPSFARRYLLPSGPLSLPILVLILAKGYRINTVFPMTTSGPAILQLIRISALAFETSGRSDASYVFLESSTLSGVLHAALYLDSVVMPYYTGMEALTSSAASGECRSCVCRDRALTVGGRVGLFRGWSPTTAVVAGALFLRIVGKVVVGENMNMKKHVRMSRAALEGLSWMLIGAETLYLLTAVPGTRAGPAPAAYAAVFLLMCLRTAAKLCAWITTFCATQHTSPTATWKGRGPANL